MSDAETVTYSTQYQVCRREGQSLIEVIYHRPGRAGFVSKELAEAAMEQLRKAGHPNDPQDRYEIVPILVASDYEMEIQLVDSSPSDPELDVTALPGLKFN